MKNPRGNVSAHRDQAYFPDFTTQSMLGLGALHQFWVMHMLHRYRHMFRDVNGMILLFHHHHYLMILCMLI